MFNNKRLTHLAVPTSAVLLALVQGLSCSSSDDSPTSTSADSHSGGGTSTTTLAESSAASSGAFAETCGNVTQCQADLICAQAGVAAGLCTTLCETNEQCRVLHGTTAECEEAACVLRCSEDANCPASSACYKNYLTCIVPPPPLPLGTWRRTIVGLSPPHVPFPPSDLDDVTFQEILTFDEDVSTIRLTNSDESIVMGADGSWSSKDPGEFWYGWDCPESDEHPDGANPPQGVTQQWQGLCDAAIIVDKYTIDESKLVIEAWFSGDIFTLTYERVQP